MLPFPSLTPPIPWGLLAGAVIAVCVAGSGWYLIHQLRAGDAREIAALADVANRNADRVAAERAQAASYAAKVKTHSEDTAAVQERLRAALTALQEHRDALPAADPVCDCRPSWVREPPAGGEGGTAVP